MKFSLSSSPKQLTAADLKIGQIGLLEGSVMYGAGDPLLRTYAGFVNLAKPGSTWPTSSESAIVLTRILQVGESVTLTVVD